RRYQCYHAEWLVTRKIEGVRLVGWDHRAFDLVGEPTIVPIPPGHVFRLQRHLGIELAIVADLDLRQPRGVLLDKIGEPKQEPAALRGPQAGPFAFEGLARRLDRAIDIGCIAMGNLRPRLARIGVDAVKSPG